MLDFQKLHKHLADFTAETITSMKTVFFFTQATSNQEEYIYSHISSVLTEATVTAIETENKRLRLKL